ncbi:serine hydrolase domain-containing protein [Nakamurella sp.]|uniref:serine hydrolase domain-containing protein n=1 Tax=Nakamurella sp. TaxID=1869182 RepID=UPI0037848077
MNRNRLIAVALAVGLIGMAGCTSSNSSASSTTLASTTASGATGSGAASGPASASAGAEPAYVAKVSASVEQTMTDNVIPGAVVLISSKDEGEWTGTFGTRTWGMDDPIQATDQFRIGSNTKTMTSTVILQLVQEGKLALNDPISKYIPGVPGGDGITIANLSEMRSGLYSYSFDPTFNNTLDQQPQKVWTPQELLDIAFGHPQNGPPGQEFNYSNTNIILLGLVIEKLTGMTASQAFEERIFTPLDLKDTSLPLNSDVPNPHPQGYSFGSNTSTIDTFALPAADQPLALDGRLLPNNETMANPSWAWTAGGAISTVQEMKTYVEAMVDGGLLDAATQKIRMDSIQPINPAQPESGYGLGIVKFDKLYGHDGQIPGYMTFMGHDPESGLTIVIATNLATIPNGEGSALAILKGILPIFYPNMVVPGDPAAAPGATGSGAPTSAAATSTGG